MQEHLDKIKFKPNKNNKQNTTKQNKTPSQTQTSNNKLATPKGILNVMNFFLAVADHAEATGQDLSNTREE